MDSLAKQDVVEAKQGAVEAKQKVAEAKQGAAEVNQGGLETNETKVYLARDIQILLGIGKSRCYTYLEEVYRKQKPFRVIKIGRLFRVPKQSFDAWLNGCN